jgi:GxxExxY protein
VLLYEEITRKIIGAEIEVHQILGPGFLESVYQKALEKELRARNIRFKQQDPIKVMYKGEQLGVFKPDLLVEDKVVVEIKAVACFVPAHEAKAIHYLTATGMHLALLLNFGTPKMSLKRIIL